MKRFIVLLALFCSLSTFAQLKLTEADYAQATKFLGFKVFPMVDNVFIQPHWINGEEFWYVNRSKFYLVNAKKKTTSPVFDQEKLAALLSASEQKNYRADSLPFSSIEISDDKNSIYFETKNQAWQYNIAQNKVSLNPAGKRQKNTYKESVSPDKTKAAFIRNDNLWIRELASGKEYPLTTDGVKNYGYATDNAGWKHSDAPVVLWSPDSKKIATFQQDQRKVGDMYLVTTNVGHPELQAWKYPLPGDSNVIMIERVIIEVENPKVIRLKIPADYHRSTLGDDIVEDGKLADAQWSEDGTTLAFVSSSRDHKNARFRIADAATGEVREVFEETVATQFESGQSAISWRYLPQSNEVIWYSERDNWGHLYLYDSKTGQLKNQVTKGEFVVAEIARVDEKSRKIYFIAAGLDKKNPYFEHVFVLSGGSSAS